jgi:hypothetical protein
MAPALLVAVLGVVSATLNLDTEAAKVWVEWREGKIDPPAIQCPAPPSPPSIGQARADQAAMIARVQQLTSVKAIP